jgi:hypothetical protein
MDDRELDSRLTYLTQLCESIWEQVKPEEVKDETHGKTE